MGERSTCGGRVGVNVIIQDQAQFYKQALEQFRQDTFDRCRGFRKYAMLDQKTNKIITLAKDMDIQCTFLGTWNTPTTTHYIYGLQSTDEQAMLIKMAL